ncbi:MAG TPA: VWA domain-containing protein [Candidatus Saccharimonadales bacterium]|nr:VWA domain-containing protein [Candidatus Saccharimonadales bacterium]
MQLLLQVSTRQRLAVLLPALLMAVSLNSISLNAADGTGYTVRSSTNEVRLAFAASDRHGKRIKELLPSDVAVADNGTIIRHFKSFRPASESPLDLVILLDASDSLELQISAEIVDVNRFISGTAWGKRDRVSILAFGGLRPMLICARNCNSQAISVKLSTLRASGATPLYDALVSAAEILEQNRDSQARPAMILFSDGMDTISMHSMSEAVLAAENLQAAIYCVNARSKKSSQDRGDAVLDKLAGNTGGLSFPPGQDVASVLRAVLEDLHGGYVLTYDLPEQTAGQHSVRILPTRDPRLQLRSRLAYDESASQ